ATELARFLEPDPIGFASGQLNLYSYVGNDPVNFTDPSGLVVDDCEGVKEGGCELPKSGSAKGSPPPAGYILVEGHRPPPPPHFKYFRPIPLFALLFLRSGGSMAQNHRTIIYAPPRKINNKRRKRNIRICSTFQVEGSVGFQVGFSISVGVKKAVGAGIALQGDASTIRFRAGATFDGSQTNFNSGFFLTQGASGSAFLGVAHPSLNISVGGSIFREVQIGGFRGFPAVLVLAKKPFTRAGPEPFVGLELGGALLFGFDIKIGFIPCR
ncbi:MAG: RHS repeat-associated core domain-containing protein, partial [Methanobacteriota archaeon]